MSSDVFNRPQFRANDFGRVCAKVVIKSPVRDTLVLYGLSPKLANVALIIWVLKITVVEPDTNAQVQYG